MEYGEVVVFFHEFGHLLHALFAGRQRWLYNGMSHLEWDFVEAPSQFFEEWARTPSILARFARDPATGAPIPAELIERIDAASALGRPVGALRQVALSSVSLELYSRAPAGRDLSADALATINRYGPSRIPSDYHFVAAFGHLAGYSAFYYTYVWSAVIARDLLSPFLGNGGILDPALARKYAAGILAPGSRRPAAELVRAFLGRDVSFDAYERWATQRPEGSVPGPATAHASPAPAPAPLTNA